MTPYLLNNIGKKIKHTVQNYSTDKIKNNSMFTILRKRTYLPTVRVFQIALKEKKQKTKILSQQLAERTLPQYPVDLIPKIQGSIP